MSADGSKMYMVSDHGSLYETDLEGNIIRKAPLEGTDFEGVWADENYIYVVDERMRKVYKLDQNFNQLNVYTVPYSGARNSCYEGITYNKAKGCFILMVEKSPVTLLELNKDFEVINEVFLKVASDISAATWHGNKLWLLSDEDAKIICLDPNTYKQESSYKINLLNPEGIAFAKDGTLRILSDDMQTIYKYSAIN
jgi:uncharacterized protein YjiK